ncbi:MAG TPA: hypothetical protein VNS52_05700, partial [Gemmatimonadaceae bacterium]|nr:hypothetical protein [Gemmatimonadaceae bacterium]
MQTRPCLSLGAAALALVVSSGCREAAVSFGPTPAAAESSARDLFAAMAERFTNVERAPRFARARGKLGRYALTPSKIYDDSSIWLPAAASSPADGARVLTLEGAFTGGRYLFVPVADAPPPTRLGDSRHAMRLRRLGENEYEWTTGVEQAVGGVRAASIEDVYTALLASAVRRGAAGDGALRADYRAAFPRATATLGQLFTLAGVHATPGADGASSVLVTIGVHPDGLRARYPHFADYADKYVVPSRFHVTLRDARGARWLDATKGESVMTIELRAAGDGRMVPLDGPARPMPDSLTLTGEFFTHIMIFDVGVSELRAGVAVLRTAHERGWFLRFATEPEWHLPLATRYLLRAPLRRPFAEGGATLRIAARDSPDAQTLLTRHMTLAVQESAILR